MLEEIKRTTEQELYYTTPGELSSAIYSRNEARLKELRERYKSKIDSMNFLRPEVKSDDDFESYKKIYGVLIGIVNEALNQMERDKNDAGLKS